MIRPDPEKRAEWKALADMYSFLYGESLQARLAEMRFDVAAWYWIGRSLELPGPARRQRDLTAGPHTPVWPPRRSRRPESQATVASVAEPATMSETPPRMLGSPLSGRPDPVKEIVMRTSAQTGVPVSAIMGKRRRWEESQARRLCVRRLAAMPWCGGHASHQQIAQWMNMERTSVLAILR